MSRIFDAIDGDTASEQLLIASALSTSQLPPTAAAPQAGRTHVMRYIGAFTEASPPFIVLERETNRQDGRGVHVISLAEKKILKLGRGHESDVRFADVSISRWHASVYYTPETKQFTLTDHSSKFGTLVAMRAPVALDLDQHLTLQTQMNLLHGHDAFC